MGTRFIMIAIPAEDAPNGVLPPDAVQAFIAKWLPFAAAGEYIDPQAARAAAACWEKRAWQVAVLPTSDLIWVRLRFDL